MPLDFNNILMILVSLIVLFVIYKCFFAENFVNQNLLTTEKPGEIWGVNSADQIWKASTPCPNDNCNWQNVSGQLKYIAQGPHDVWGVGRGLKIGTGPELGSPVYRCTKPCNGQWTQVPSTNISFDKLSVGKDIVFGLTSDYKMYYCPNTPDAPCTGNWVFENDGGLESVSIK